MSSTAKNLMFLEAQLGQYMHEHYEDGGVLYTKPVGFRMPYTRGVDELERNMKYVEAQLDKYLHEHESGVTSASAEFVDDYILGNLPGSIRSLPHDMTYGGGFLWTAQSGTNPQRIVKHDPADGSYVTHYQIANNANDSLQGIEYVSGTLYVLYAQGDLFNTPTDVEIWTIDASDGTVLTSGASLGEDGHRSIAYLDGSFYVLDLDGDVRVYNSSFTLTDTLTGDVNDLAIATDGTYLFTANFGSTFNTIKVRSADWSVIDQFSHDRGNIGPIAINGTRLYLNVSADFVDMLDFTLGQGILYWTPSGFRFPYDWKRTNATNDNRRFLETELSKYLHVHEEGYVPPPGVGDL